jgi:hypothetical protein
MAPVSTYLFRDCTPKVVKMAPGRASSPLFNGGYLPQMPVVPDNGIQSLQ